jgi:hypothetical protein
MGIQRDEDSLLIADTLVVVFSGEGKELIGLDAYANQELPPPPPKCDGLADWDADKDWCTFVPDFDLHDAHFKCCCFLHDKCYGVPGLSPQRRDCDEEFARCIFEAGYPLAKWFYFWGVRIFGRAFYNYEHW